MEKLLNWLALAVVTTALFVPRELFAETDLSKKSARQISFDSFDGGLFVDSERRPLEEDYE